MDVLVGAGLEGFVGTIDTSPGFKAVTEAHEDADVGVAELVDVLVEVRVRVADAGWGDNIAV